GKHTNVDAVVKGIVVVVLDHRQTKQCGGFLHGNADHPVDNPDNRGAVGDSATFDVPADTPDCGQSLTIGDVKITIVVAVVHIFILRALECVLTLPHQADMGNALLFQLVAQH